jgi:hypothetical protein
MDGNNTLNEWLEVTKDDSTYTKDLSRRFLLS